MTLRGTLLVCSKKHVMGATDEECIETEIANLSRETLNHAQRAGTVGMCR